LDESVNLGDEELSLKKQVEGSIRTFFQMYEEFTLNKTTLDLAGRSFVKSLEDIGD